MNKDFYTFARIFFALAAFSGIVNGVIFLLIGNEILTWNSFLAWSFISLLSNIIGSILMLKYFSMKGYHSARIALSINLFFGIAQSIVYFVHL